MSRLETERVVHLNSRHHEAELHQLQEKPLKKPRLGRRESEPHSHKINYLYDVLSTNFPNDRTFWDLHHYFNLDGERVDLQFDISYFRGLKLSEQVPSFNSDDFEGLRPTMAVNILSTSTYNSDLGLTAQTCQELGIPVYVIFSDHIFEPRAVKAPFLKIIYEEGGKYQMAELHEPCCKEGEEIDPTKLLDVRPDLLPFKFGIMLLNEKYLKKGKRYPLYQLVLIDRKTGKRLKTKTEIAMEKIKEKEQKIKEAEQKIKEVEQKAKEAEKKAEEERQRCLELEHELERLKNPDK